MDDELLNADQMINEMRPPSKTASEYLEKLVSKGIDEELLDYLRTQKIDTQILNDLKNNYTPLDRIQRLELLVERLLLRVSRLERDNEYRNLEIATVSLELAKFVQTISPMMNEIYTHFFAK